MVSSAPKITFAPTLLNYGTLNVGSTSAKATYRVKNASGSYAKVTNHSISMVPSTNSAELVIGSWVWISNAKAAAQVSSTNETPGGTIAQSKYEVEKYILKVPSAPNTSGTVRWKHRHRYQYTG